jgi:hypothetical protein
MMWKTATALFVALGILSLVVTEVLRSIVDRKRRERDGLGGTQDIAICGMVFGWICVVAAIVCGAGWLLTK